MRTEHGLAVLRGRGARVGGLGRTAADRPRSAVMATRSVVIDPVLTALGWGGHEAGAREKEIGRWSALPRPEDCACHFETRVMQANG